jgi:hypothetical protein
MTAVGDNARSASSDKANMIVDVERIERRGLRMLEKGLQSHKDGRV